MNAVEIEQAVSDLALQPFDGSEFPFALLAAFGHKETALKRLRTGNSNQSDVSGAAVTNAVLLRNHLHLAVCAPGQVEAALQALRASAANAKGKPKFLLATDGQTLEAEDLTSGETIACAYPDFPDHFGFFLPLAGISTVPEIKENPVDVRATGRLNKLYVELLKENPDWAAEARRADMNHFMARLIFCFFAEDTDIFHGEGLFTRTVETFSESESANTHEVLSEIFRAMNVPIADRIRADRAAASFRPWADQFPYVNGGLFSGSTDVPRFSRMARTYLLHAGNLNWQKINPDIFGSMIQAVADDEERGALGMHYTSVPNILKVLNPLFLDELRAQLDAAGQDKRKLLILRRRMARIRVFDPACGSGNFLVIAYKQMRAIEAQINERRGEKNNKSEIPLTNFRGIELRDFAAEIARLALIIAEYQCDVLYRGQKQALAEFLPLDAENWIVCRNALRLDWLSVCPPTGKGVKLAADDLFETPLDQAEIDFENEGGETFICGNPPYRGSKWQSGEQKADLAAVFAVHGAAWKTLDYVAGWFMKAASYGAQANASTAFVSTNSICQGVQVPTLWPLLFATGHQIIFAHTSFKWANLASHNAGVTVVIVGISQCAERPKVLFATSDKNEVIATQALNINAYLVPGPDIIVHPLRESMAGCAYMDLGNMPKDGGHLLLSGTEATEAIECEPAVAQYLFDFVGSQEFVRGIIRKCLWVEDAQAQKAKQIPLIAKRLAGVRAMRLASDAESTRAFADRPHRFKQIQGRGLSWSIVVPKVSSESREYLPVGLLTAHSVVSDNAFALYDAPLWNLALIASRMHLVWIATVCGKMKTDFRYSNTLGWNTFPVPALTAQNKADLTEYAENILLAREAHFPATIAELYIPEKMPENLRHAHERNDEVLERIYIGRRFRNDTERLEKLFELYTKMTATAAKAPAKKATRRKA